MKIYNYINRGETISLATLILSGDIDESNVIAIYDEDGKFIAKGKWYEDNILEWSDYWGIATKAGTGLTITFKLT